MGLETEVLGPDHNLPLLTWSPQVSHLPSLESSFFLPQLLG